MYGIFYSGFASEAVKLEKTFRDTFSKTKVMIFFMYNSAIRFFNATNLSFGSCSGVNTGERFVIAPKIKKERYILNIKVTFSR